MELPLLTPAAILVDALAAGNAVVLKPSQITPGVAEWLVRTWQRAVPELPAVLQSLNGYGATGQALIEAGLDKLAFTGSVATGKTVAAQCAQTLTPVLLELGGKDGVIVAEDADLDEAAAHVVWGAMQNTGHGCISLEVAYVVESVHDEFVRKISELAGQVRVGSDEDAEIGPVPLPSQTSIIREHIKDALERGATATVGGLDAVGDRYVAPTVLVGVAPDALAATEETFGPTLAVIKVADADEAVAHINAGRYGLGSAVFSRDRGEAIARRLRVGMTSINDALVFSMNPAVPFGGRGDSGYGRKQGEEGLREFAYAHSFTAKTGPARFSASTFGRPQGAMAEPSPVPVAGSWPRAVRSRTDSTRGLRRTFRAERSPPWVPPQAGHRPAWHPGPRHRTVLDPRRGSAHPRVRPNSPARTPAWKRESAPRATSSSATLRR